MNRLTQVRQLIETEYAQRGPFKLPFWCDALTCFCLGCVNKNPVGQRLEPRMSKDEYDEAIKWLKSFDELIWDGVWRWRRGEYSGASEHIPGAEEQGESYIAQH